MRRSPLGNPLFWVVAAFVIPEIVKKCKPLAKTVGDTLVSAGEAFRRAAEKPEPATAVVEAPVEPVAAEEESKPAEEPKAAKKSKKSSDEPAPEATAE